MRRFSRRQLIAYVALAVVVVAVGVRYLVLDQPAAEAGGERLVLAPASSPSGAAPGPAAVSVVSPSPIPDVLVHVCGAVRRPGVVQLPQGARVADALDRAGGATAKGDLAGVNLAARVADGQQIVVPERGSGTAAASAAAAGGSTSAAAVTSSGAPPGAPVNINTASATELEALPGVGPATAQRIVEYRTAQGGFKSIEELKNVPGIGDAKFAAMKDAVGI